MKSVLLIKLIRESSLFALQAIISNKLRTFLSLLGITIGIFAIISVFTVVDSMENNIRKNLENLGDNVLFIQKWPWFFGGGGSYPWWKYVNRPQPSIEELKEIQNRSFGIKSAVFVAAVNKTVEYGNNSLSSSYINMVSTGYEEVSDFEIEQGRFISESEFTSGKPVAIIGYEIAQNLFNNQYPIGKKIKIMGRKLEVIGVMTKQGNSMFGNSTDNQVIIPVFFAQTLIDIKGDHIDPVILVKPKNGISTSQLQDELIGIFRSIRKLKPQVEDNFSINESSLLSKGFESIFAVLSVAGWIIGGFSILVGGFGIANIMFVSVKEQTAIIGIQKSLGAKNYFIMLQFLFEAILLSTIGGILGLLIIYLGTVLVSKGMGYELALTGGNIFTGLSISAVIGLLSGLIPAYTASKLDPVEAMRSV